MYADGSTSDGITYGAWLVMNTKVGRDPTENKYIADDDLGHVLWCMLFDLRVSLN